MARRSNHAKKIDVVHWTGIFGGFLSLSSGGTAALNMLAAQHLPETLLRIRGAWSVALAGAQATGVAVRVTMGLILVPEGTGTTVLWSPQTDADAPWIWWSAAPLLYEESVTDAIASQNTMSKAGEIDSKAMRHVRNQELQLVAENGVVSSTSAVRISCDGRVLSGS